MQGESARRVSGVVRAWVDAYMLRRAADPDLAAYDGWAFTCTCSHRWDDGGEPPKWDATVEMRFLNLISSDAETDWSVYYDYVGGSMWVAPYPTYQKLLDPSAPLLNDREMGGGEPNVEALQGPDVLDLHARLRAVGEPFLPQEGMGGTAEVMVRASGTEVRVVLVRSAVDGAEATRFEVTL